MASVFVILPDCLFSNIEAFNILKVYSEIYLVEDPVFFNPSYGKSKLVMHRASMRDYHKWLTVTTTAMKNKAKGTPEEKNIRIHSVSYVPYDKIKAKGDTIFDYFIGIKKQVNMYRLSNNWEYKDHQYDYTFNGLNVTFHETPGFLLTYRSIRDNCKPSHRYGFTSTFRKIVSKMRLPIEILEADEPTEEPSSKILDLKIGDSPTYKAATDYVNKHFTTTGGTARYAINCTEADELLNIFLKVTLPQYQSGDISMILPQINIGLLTPRKVIYTVIDHYKKHKQKHSEEISPVRVKLLIKDLVFREYLRMLYLADGDIAIRRIYGNDLQMNNWHLAASNKQEKKYLNQVNKRIKSGEIMNQHVLNNLVLYFTVSGYNPVDILNWLCTTHYYYPWCAYPSIPDFSSDLRLPTYKFDTVIPLESYKHKLLLFKTGLVKKASRDKHGNVVYEKQTDENLQNDGLEECPGDIPEQTPDDISDPKMFRIPER